MYEYGFKNGKTTIRPILNIRVTGSNSSSFLCILAGKMKVTFVLNRCFIRCDISDSTFTSVVLSLAVSNSLNRESNNKY